MGMKAKVIVFGKFELMKQVPEVLDYPIEFYEATQDSTIVFGTATAVNTHDASQEIAYALGIYDPWDFNSHKITEIDWLTLDQHYLTDQEVRDFSLIEKCLNLDLEVYYQPNG